MLFVKIVFSLVLLFLGLCYLYQPHIIIRINEWVREILLNDELLINHRKKIGLILILISLLLLILH